MRNLPDSLLRTIRAHALENNTNRWPDLICTRSDTQMSFRAVWIDRAWYPTAENMESEDPMEGIEAVTESNWREPGESQWLLKAPAGYQQWNLMGDNDLDVEADYEDAALGEDPMGKYYEYNI